MDSKYSVGDKVFTADTWNNGMGLVIPKGSIVEIRRIYEYDGVNICDCIYDTDKDSVIYDERCLGEKYKHPKIGGWIPCSERLPEETLNVLVTDSFARIYIANLIGGTFFDSEMNDIDVVAWQPLPEPYTENRKD